MCEVLWVRQLEQLLGGTALAWAATSGALFTAMGLGAFVAGLWLERGRSPRPALLLLQTATLLWMLLSPSMDGWLMASVDGWLGTASAPGFVPLHYVIALIGLFVPGFAAGALVPLLAEWVADKTLQPGRIVASLWAWDALGAAAFALLTGIVLMRHLGCDRTFLLTAALHLAVVMLLWRRGEPKIREGEVESEASGEGSSKGKRGRGKGKKPERQLADRRQALAPGVVFFQLALIGAASVGWQALWGRLLVLSLPGSLIWPALMIAAWIASTGLGALFYRRIALLRENPVVTLALGQILCAAGGWAGSALGSWLRGVLAATRPHSPAFVYELFVALAMGAVAALAVGVMLPAAVDLVRSPRTGAGQATGYVVASDVVGALLGSLFIPLFLLPWLGLMPALLVMGAAQLLGGLLLWMWPSVGERGPLRRALAPAFLLALGAAWLLTSADLRPWSPLDGDDDDGERRAVRVVWGPMATAAVVEDSDELLKLFVDRHHGMGGEKGVFIERRQAHIPLVLHGRAKSVAVIGVGTGNTLGAVTQHDVERIDAAESSIAVLQMLDLFAATNNQVWRDERLRVANLDGQVMLRRSSQRYDVIIGDLVHPWRAGAAGLYSREHLRVVRSRLAEGGLFCFWLPLHELSGDDLSITVASFLDVFDGGTALLGHLGRRQPILALVGGGPEALLERDRLARQLGASTPSYLVNVDIDSPEDLQSLYLGGSEWLRRLAGGSPVTTLDRPELAYRSSETWWRGIDGLGEQRLAALLERREELSELLPDDERGQRRHSAVGRLLRAELDEAAGHDEAAAEGYIEAARLDPSFNLPRIALELLRRRVGGS